MTEEEFLNRLDDIRSILDAVHRPGASEESLLNAIDEAIDLIDDVAEELTDYVSGDEEEDAESAEDDEEDLEDAEEEISQVPEEEHV